MTVIQQLSQTVEDVRTDEESLLHYGTDRSRYKAPSALAVVFPKSTAEVQALVLLANELGFALVPSGGRTGLSGGAIAHQQEVVVSFERMNKVLEVNTRDRSVRCQEGVTPSSCNRSSATTSCSTPLTSPPLAPGHLAGNIATNASGIRVIA